MHFSKNRSPALIALAILTAGLLIAMTWGPPPDRKNVVRATHQSSGTNRASAPQPPTGFKTPLAQQRLVGGYWRTDHTFQPTLIITNVMQQIELAVTPVLYAADGTEYPLPSITLAPAGVASVDIRAALSAAPEEVRDHFSDFGSAAVKYVWHSAGAATALVENRDVPRSLIFNFELRAPVTSMAGMAAKHGATKTVKEGLWWKEDSGVKAFLALVNTASHPVNIQVQTLSDYAAFESERTIPLQTNETRKLELLDDAEGSSGGIRVSYDGAESDVALAGGLANPREGYSAQIPFLEVSPDAKPSTVELSSVGLMFGAPDPMMKFPSGTTFGVYLALRNIASRPILVSPTLYYTQGTEVIKTVLNPLPLAARQARHWTPDELSAELGLPKFDGIINLVFSYQGGRGDVIMASGSIDQTKNYVFEIKMELVSQSLGKGLKDWDVSNGNDTMISLLNLDEKDQDLAVTFFFDGGHYKLPVHLRAGESTMFNVSDIIMRQQPDADGNTIPPNTPHGTAVLAAASANLQWFKVGASLGIFNVSTATCGGQCNNCGDFVDYRVQADIGTALIGQQTEFSAWGYSVSMGWVNVTLQSQWTSSDIQIAPPDPSIIGAFDGASPGSFQAQGSATLQMGDTCPEGCDPTFWVDGAAGVVQVPTSLTVLTDTKVIDMSYGHVGGQTCSNSGNYGIEIAVHYQIVDQSGAAIDSASMEPQEKDPDLGLNNWADIGPSGYPGTSQFTDANGQFWDAPVGVCATSSFFISDTQYISILVNGVLYPVSSFARTNNWTTSSTSVSHGSTTNHADISELR